MVGTCWKLLASSEQPWHAYAPPEGAASRRTEHEIAGSRRGNRLRKPRAGDFGRRLRFEFSAIVKGGT